METGGAGPSVPANLFPALEKDGSPAKGAWQMTATIPPRAGSGQTRRFRLEEVAGAAARETPAAWRFADVDDKSLGLWEGKAPVLVYNHGIMSREGVPADRNRSTYVHPLYGLDGEVLTDDFPKDHYHHRGIFWTWLRVGVDGKNYDLWTIKGIHQKFERWLERKPGEAAAILGVENGWYVGDEKIMQERVWLRAYPATAKGRMLDIDLYLIPVNKPVSLAGDPKKSYSGLTIRFAPRTQTVITTPLGQQNKDLENTPLPWADFTAQFAGAPQPSGAALLIAPDHPDYPPPWLTRHYGALCLGWPGTKPVTYQPGEIIHCGYRIWVHRQGPDVAAMDEVYQSYLLRDKVTWENPKQ